MIVTLTGPSCAGKSHLEKMLKAKGFEVAVSSTTRAQREGEVDGESYYFTSKSEFKRLKAQGAFVETVEFNDNYYGLRRHELERLMCAGKHIVIVCEPHGQKQIAHFCEERGWPVHAVFVDNPTEVIAERFMRRFADEMQCWGESQIADKTKNYASRLVDMMTTERGWVAEAYGTWGLYDTIVFNFDAETADGVVDRVVEACGELRQYPIEEKVA